VSRRSSGWLREKHPGESSAKKVNKEVNTRLFVWAIISTLTCLGCILVPGVSSIPSHGMTLDIQDLKKKLESGIRESGAEVGLAFKDMESGESLLIEADVMMHAASLMKVPLMIEVFRQAEQGRFRLDEKILVKNEFKSIVDGSLYSLTVTDDSDDDIYRYIDKELSIRELVHRMITVSSNLATNILIELVDAQNIMKTLAGLSIHKMKVLRGVEDLKAYEKGLNNQTDAWSMMQVMLSLVEGTACSKEACKEMIDILSRQKFRAKIPAGIPDGIRVANKTGSITRIDHDAAIVFPIGRKPYVLVILTRGIENREEAERLIAGLSSIVYQKVVSLPFDIKENEMPNSSLQSRRNESCKDISDFKDFPKRLSGFSGS
jgi:beta-lactamase class A